MSFDKQMLLVIVSVGFAVTLHFANVERKKISKRQQQRMEHEQRINDLIDKKANQYWDMERIEDSGLSALAKVNLYELGSDEFVRKCIEKIKLSSQTDPWQGQEESVKDVDDLSEFFKFVCKNRIWPSNIKVEQAVREFQIDKEK